MYAQDMLQQQQLSSNQLLSLKILMMDAVELEKFIHDEYSENPLLEIVSPDPQYETLSNYFNKTDYYISSGIIHDEPMSPYVTTEIPSLQDYLVTQLIGKDHFSQIDWNIFYYVVHSLDSRGFLSLSPSEISLHLHVPLQQVVSCLRTLQSLEPAGVCASNVRESLILQARRKGIMNPQLENIISHYLQEIASGQYNKISKALKISRQKLNQYIKIIKTLNPNPCRHFGNFSKEYIVPDIILTFESYSWIIIINDSWSGSLGISKLYKQYSATANPAMQHYIEEKIKRARLVLSCIESRRRTLRRIMTYITKKQENFFLNNGPISGISIKETANDLSIHPSTVSRAIRNKYIQTPRGTFPGKYFFQKLHISPDEHSAAALSVQEIKHTLTTLISNEPKSAPYTDTKLVSLLAQRGILLSRRSVVNYRRECNIKSSYERKTAYQ